MPKKLCYDLVTFACRKLTTAKYSEVAGDKCTEQVGEWQRMTVSLGMARVDATAAPSLAVGLVLVLVLVFGSERNSARDPLFPDETL